MLKIKVILMRLWSKQDTERQEELSVPFYSTSNSRNNYSKMQKKTHNILCPLWNFQEIKWNPFDGGARFLLIDCFLLVQIGVRKKLTVYRPFKLIRKFKSHAALNQTHYDSKLEFPRRHWLTSKRYLYLF